MGVVDLVTSPLRWALGASERAETEVGRHSPLTETRALEAELHEAVTAVHRACEATERHVTVLESLTDSLPALTESVTRLSDQVGALLTVVGPMAATEKEISHIGHFFGRRRHVEEPAQTDQPVGPEELPS